MTHVSVGAIRVPLKHEYTVLPFDSTKGLAALLQLTVHVVPLANEPEVVHPSSPLIRATPIIRKPKDDGRVQLSWPPATPALGCFCYAPARCRSTWVRLHNLCPKTFALKSCSSRFAPSLLR
jgi:hypothetical protein